MSNSFTNRSPVARPSSPGRGGNSSSNSAGSASAKGEKVVMTWLNTEFSPLYDGSIVIGLALCIAIATKILQRTVLWPLAHRKLRARPEVRTYGVRVPSPNSPAMSEGGEGPEGVLMTPSRKASERLRHRALGNSTNASSPLHSSTVSTPLSKKSQRAPLLPKEMGGPAPASPINDEIEVKKLMSLRWKFVTAGTKAISYGALVLYGIWVLFICGADGNGIANSWIWDISEYNTAVTIPWELKHYYYIESAYYVYTLFAMFLEPKLKDRNQMYAFPQPLLSPFYWSFLTA